jgi:pyrimidine-nucleoside phosphorylase
METVEEARELAEMMVEIAELAGRKAVGLISDMNQPLGFAVGNAIEVKEAIETTKGDGPPDFLEHCLEVAAYMVLLAERTDDLENARKMVKEVYRNGEGLEKFRKLVEVQGGDVSYVDQPEKLPKAKLVETVRAFRSGYLKQINAREIGEMSVVLGAGRLMKGQPVNHAVGIVVHHKVGDFVRAGDDLFTIHADDRTKLEEVRGRLQEAHLWSDEQVDPLPLFYGVLSDQD